MWYKMLHSGDAENLKLIRALVAADITPVVRMAAWDYWPGRNPAVLHHARSVIDAGAEYIETHNEPNIEWQTANWQDDAKVAAFAQSWWLDSLDVIRMGGKAAFPAMAPTDRGAVNHTRSGVMWASKLLGWANDHHRDEMVKYLRSGQIWLAVHVSPFNKPFDFDPERGSYIDDFCLLYYEVLQYWFDKTFGVVPVTVSTEGGAYSPGHMRHLGFPVQDGADWVVDDRGRALYNWDTWGDYTRAMYAFLKDRGTLDGMCTWTFSDEGVHDQRWLGSGWYDAHGNPRSPAQVLRQK